VLDPVVGSAPDDLEALGDVTDQHLGSAYTLGGRISALLA
jgi:hypothetical protein